MYQTVSLTILSRQHICINI